MTNLIRDLRYAARALGRTPGFGIAAVSVIAPGIGAITAPFNARLDTTLLLAFAVLSLVLAAVGLFGMLSYIVAQRTTEVGIRIPLGAKRHEVLRLTHVDGLRPACVGLVLGLAGGVAAAKMIRNLLYGVQPLDTNMFATVTITLLGVALAACYIPARRTASVDPMVALRYE